MNVSPAAFPDGFGSRFRDGGRRDGASPNGVEAALKPHGLKEVKAASRRRTHLGAAAG